MEYLLLILGFVLIIVGATALTDGSVALAARFRVPEFIVGLTIVAVGTSMPEFVVSLFASIDGNDSIAIGNIVGSNIFNIFASSASAQSLHPSPSRSLTFVVISPSRFLLPWRWLLLHFLVATSHAPRVSSSSWAIS